MDFPPFPGFRDAAFDLLRGLKQHNRRDWFQPRKQVFKDEVEWPLQCLVVDAAREAQRRHLPLAGDPARSLFRIYRDIRFSRNKQPYKTHAGAVLSRSGERNDPGVVYIHVEPGASFLAAGFWRPPMALLRPWRLRITDDPAGFRQVLAALEDRGLTLDPGTPLTRMPRGFEAYAGTEIAPLLQWTSFTVSRPVADEALRTPAFTQDVVRLAQDALPLLSYGWAILDRS
ncbi:TIGR02453 family protein [Rhodothermaceae bacterium RA]|nr:TIGR02453 family protein [Rhodothermaceae bacterium RA]